MANPMDSNPQTSSEQLDRVCIIGSGNWGSAISKLVGRNCERLPFFESQVNMWVYEEMVDVQGDAGVMEKRQLTDVINTRHENTKYLPGIKLPENVVAVADLATAVQDAAGARQAKPPPRRVFKGPKPHRGTLIAVSAARARGSRRASVARLDVS